LEGEEGDAADSEGGGDRRSLGLPGSQEQLIKDVAAFGKPVIVVLTGGSALAIPWLQDNVSAILAAWYPGEEGGNAVADVLFGGYNPSGRLPVTFYRATEDLPPFDDYAMANRTYRYFKGEPLYRFGFGLSYTTFGYADLDLRGGSRNDSLTVSASVMNVGSVAGDEVVQVYVSDLDAPGEHPIRALKGFARVSIEPGQTKRVTLVLPPDTLARVGQDGREALAPGRFRVSIGGGQPIGPDGDRCLVGEIVRT
jgi:beta-glucosidase